LYLLLPLPIVEDDVTVKAEDDDNMDDEID
jgi:hypothetical protein